MIQFFDDVIRQEFDKITPLERTTYAMTDSIAGRIDAIMKRKGISKVELARRTSHRPSEVTKWLGGGHNFTCKTITLISQALGEDLIRVVRTRQTAQ